MFKKFYWGNSSSAMQTEGAWNLDGKGLSIYDIKEPAENISDWKDGIDAYHRYEEDSKIMQDLGMNMYRFSLSWSRIDPAGDGTFNEAGIAFYHRFIDDLIANNIEPMLCLHHFDVPLTLAEKYNGFVNRKVVDAFEHYAKRVIDEFSPKVKHFISFNEQNLYLRPERCFVKSGYLEGEQTTEEIFKVMHNLTMAHCFVANYIHENTDAYIAGMLSYTEVYPETSHPKDVFATREWDEFTNYNIADLFIRGEYSKSVMRYLKNHQIDIGLLPGDLETMKKQSCDYLAFSYYASNTISHKLIDFDKAPNYYLVEGRVKNPYLDESEWHWEIDPLGFRNVMNKLYSRYNVPIFPIENGIGVMEVWDGIRPVQDSYRIEYHEKHIKALLDARDIDGVDIPGYLGWGLIDFPSSLGDMRKRYGTVYVNRDNHDLKDLKRIPKKSYAWFKETFHSNAANLKNGDE
ncbi:glycoside hydrolase family 1 protein [Enterococcus sp. AZ126]|uniref:glycoside hydrolase family 1 protein n=1 Tax=Enterococcus sp. AZ126 TaxID=2774635 RepID=UPI003F27DD72